VLTAEIETIELKSRKICSVCEAPVLQEATVCTPRVLTVALTWSTLRMSIPGARTFPSQNSVMHFAIERETIISKSGLQVLLQLGADLE
jgi:hypothetical protein